MGDVNLEIKLNNLDERVIKIEGSGGTSITVDSELSDTSTNPVQNKVVAEALDTTKVSTTDLSNSAEGNIRSLHLYGKGEKTDDGLITSDGVVESGSKNLSKGTISQTKTENGISWNISNNHITVSGTPTSITICPLIDENLKKGTYTLFIDGVCENVVTASSISDFEHKPFPFTFTINEDTRVVINCKRKKNGTVVKVDGYVMLEEGTTPTNYVEYNHTTINASEILNSTFTGVNDIKDELIVNADGSGKFIKRVDKRAYQSGDENNASYITDLTNTIYPLSTPTETTLTSTQVAQLLSLKSFRDTTLITSDCDYEIGYFKDNETGQSVADVNTKLATLIETLKSKGVID